MDGLLIKIDSLVLDVSSPLLLLLLFFLLFGEFFLLPGVDLLLDIALKMGKK